MSKLKSIARLALGVGRLAFPQIGAALDAAEEITGDPSVSNSEAVPALLKAAKRQAEVSAEHEKRIAALEKIVKQRGDAPRANQSGKG